MILKEKMTSDRRTYQARRRHLEELRVDSNRRGYKVSLEGKGISEEYFGSLRREKEGEREGFYVGSVQVFVKQVGSVFLGEPGRVLGSIIMAPDFYLP